MSQDIEQPQCQQCGKPLSIVPGWEFRYCSAECAREAKASGQEGQR